MRMNTRLRRLEEAAGVGRDDGCPTCRDRHGPIVLATSQRMPDETIRPEGEWPAPCGACGVVPEFIIEAVKPIAAAQDEVTGRTHRATNK